jgi:hypothetical protein
MKIELKEVYSMESRLSEMSELAEVVLREIVKINQRISSMECDAFTDGEYRYWDDVPGHHPAWKARGAYRYPQNGDAQVVVDGDDEEDE